MDIENIILEIYKNVGDEIKNLKIIYQDSEGVWDGVLFNICVDHVRGEVQVRVKEFVILGKENVEDAVEAYLADPRANLIEEESKAKKENYLFDVE
jgi:hypothetical protein